MAVMANVDTSSWASDTNSKQAMSRWDIVCVHTIVGNPPAQAAHFSTRSDGHIFQHRDTKFRSAANLNGNHRVIAIENDDFGPEYGAWSGSNVPGFADAQAESIAQVCAWAHHTHGIPLELCPDSKPGSRGIAYHRQGIDGNFGGFAYGGRVAGGELWSDKFGKVCPGDRRIKQLIDRIIPRARQIAGLEDDVTEEQFLAYMNKFWDLTRFEGRLGNRTLRQLTEEQGARVLYIDDRTRVMAADLSDDEANILAAVRTQAQGSVDVADLSARLTASLGPAIATELGRRLMEGNPA